MSMWRQVAAWGLEVERCARTSWPSTRGCGPRSRFAQNDTSLRWAGRTLNLPRTPHAPWGPVDASKDQRLQTHHLTLPRLPCLMSCAGCTVIEMLTGKHPWPDIDNQLSAVSLNSNPAPGRGGTPRSSCWLMLLSSFFEQVVESFATRRPCLPAWPYWLASPLFFLLQMFQIVQRTSGPPRPEHCSDLALDFLDQCFK